MTASADRQPRAKPAFLPGGLLGEFLEESLYGRLRRWIADRFSEPLALFDESHKGACQSGDWYGEHAGKWLIATSRAAWRIGDAELQDRVTAAAAFLLNQQEADGYLGTYAKSNPARFTQPAAEAVRTWDVWVHAYLILGLLEVHRHWSDERLIEGSRCIARLFRQVFDDQNRPIARYGNHQGLSSLIAIHPLAELSLATGDPDAADLALKLLDQAESDPSLRPVSRLNAGEDIAAIGTGKAYQLCWLLLGLLRLGQAKRDRELVAAAKAGWRSIREGHLTGAGGPYGGIGRHKEVFNEPGTFERYALVETCSSMAWMQLNRALLESDPEPDPIYSDEIEKTLYNSVFGAMFPGGEDWCYFVFPNGRRNATYPLACCKSSGPIALEEASLGVAELRGRQVWLHRFVPGTIDLGDGLLMAVETRYPIEGHVWMRMAGNAGMVDSLHIRIPSWATGASVKINGFSLPANSGTYISVGLPQDPIEILVEVPMHPQVHRAIESRDHHGQEIVGRPFVSYSRGPLVYAAGLLDGFKKEETIRFGDPENSTIDVVDPSQESAFPTLRIHPQGREPIGLEPYFAAGGRAEGAWRSTWLEVAAP